MHPMRSLAATVLALLITSCSSSSHERLCNRFFTPYPDLVSQRARNKLNGEFLDAMALYAKGQYAEAMPGLQRVVDRDPRNAAARIYLVNVLLAEGDPYKAEMHLDFLENSRDRMYSDQVDWYNTLCWLCEGDTARAGWKAREIAAKPHTYRQQAAQLAKALAP